MRFWKRRFITWMTCSRVNRENYGKWLNRYLCTAHTHTHSHTNIGSLSNASFPSLCRLASELTHGDSRERQSDQRAGGEGGHAGGRGQFTRYKPTSRWKSQFQMILVLVPIPMTVSGSLKWEFTQKCQMLSSFTHPYVVPQLNELFYSVEHDRRYFKKCW